MTPTCANCGRSFTQHGRGRPRRYCYDCQPMYGTIPTDEYMRIAQRLKAQHKPRAALPPRNCDQCGNPFPPRQHRCYHCRPLPPPPPPRRKRRSGLTTTQRGYGNQWQKLRLTILARDMHICHWCGAPANSVDHVIPKIEGGGNHPSNLVAACTPCNSKRSIQWTNANRGRDRRGRFF